MSTLKRVINEHTHWLNTLCCGIGSGTSKSNKIFSKKRRHKYSFEYIPNHLFNHRDHNIYFSFEIYFWVLFELRVQIRLYYHYMTNTH